MTKTAKDNISFEAAMSELEAIVQKMEAGGLTLEESLEAYTRGVELSKLCRRRLDAAQAKIQVLQNDETLREVSSEALGVSRDA